jgi:hypothetical protein
MKNSKPKIIKSMSAKAAKLMGVYTEPPAVAPTRKAPQGGASNMIPASLAEQVADMARTRQAKITLQAEVSDEALTPPTTPGQSNGGSIKSLL